LGWHWAHQFAVGEIAITLIGFVFGEEKAQSCEIA
jgi:hypothetical protein